MACLAFPILVILAAITLCVWGLMNPGRIQWGQTGVPVSRPALLGLLVFSLVAAVFFCLWLGVSETFNDLSVHARMWAVLGLFGVMATGWLIAAVTQFQDRRAAKRDQKDEDAHRRGTGT